jgi:hypothetical protein
LNLGGLDTPEHYLIYFSSEFLKDLKANNGGVIGKMYLTYLSETNMLQVRKLIEEVLRVCANDDIGITWDLYDQARRAGEEVGFTEQELDKLAGIEEDA